MKYKACVFDLDGTLLDTLPDLVRLTNQVLEEYGYPTYSKQEIQSFVGNGGHALMRQAIPATEPEEKVESALREWKDRYQRSATLLTNPYPFIPEILMELKQKGVKLAVLSNKFDAGANVVVNEKLPGLFDIVRGESPECPRKPNPQGLLNLLEDLRVEKSEVLYIGDSEGDMVTARAAGVCAIGVTWGYQDVERLRDGGAEYIVDDPRKILDLV